jgi:hypothetical protein
MTTQHPLSAKVDTTSPTSGGRSIGIVCSRSKATEFNLVVLMWPRTVVSLSFSLKNKTYVCHHFIQRVYNCRRKFSQITDQRGGLFWLSNFSAFFGLSRNILKIASDQVRTLLHPLQIIILWSFDRSTVYRFSYCHLCWIKGKVALVLN